MYIYLRAIEGRQVDVFIIILALFIVVKDFDFVGVEVCA